MPKTRPAVLAGSWYPAETDVLTTIVDGFLENANSATAPAGRPLIAIAPHAGYAYSGPTAGRLFGLLRQYRPETVIILAPNHRTPINKIALSSAEMFATPLGNLRLANKLTEKLDKNPAFQINNRAHANEHAVEIELPFIQRTWPENPPTILPALVPFMPRELREQAVDALRSIIDEKILILVSTDFTHYGHPFGYTPFVDNIPELLKQLDIGAVDHILAADAEGLMNYGRETGITMCGLAATALALESGLPDDYQSKLIDYSRSGDKENNYSMSVSYVSIILSDGLDTTNNSPKDKNHGGN